jgi:hypothetical protein
MGPGVQEATSLVYRGVLYSPNPSDLVEAINAASGDLIWEYRRKLPADVGRFLIVPSINRNLSVYGDLIIDTSVDDFVYALYGKLAWENRIVDYREDSAQEPPVPSLQMAESSAGAAANTRPRPMAASSLPTTRRPARNCGGPEPFPGPASPATKPGAMPPTATDATSAPGWYPVSTPN